jgi:hypothetical protein
MKAMRNIYGRGAASHRSTSLVVGLLVFLLASFAIAPNVSANITTRARSLSFGPDGTPATSFTALSALAFNQEGNRLYALEGNSFIPKVIHAFDAPALSPVGGAFPLTVFAGEDQTTGAVAVDNTAPPSASAGNIYYLVSGGTRKVFGFNSAGAPLGGNFPLSLPPLSGGVAVDASGNIYVSQFATGERNIRKYDSAGNFLGTISTSTVGGPAALAFDSNDNLFFAPVPLGLSDKEAEEKLGVYKATAASGYSQASFTKIPWNAEFPGRNNPSAIAVDATTHTLYVLDINRVSAFDATTGAFLYNFADGIHSTGLGGSAFEGVAVDEGTDTVYVSDDTSGQKQVHVFGPAQSYADATATPVAAKGITDSGAEIGATIADNNVLPTAWRLELSSDDGSTWSSVATGQTASKSATVASTGFSTGTLSVKAVGGAFTLVFNGQLTAPLAYNASAATVQATLEALPTIGAGNVEVTGGPGSATGSTPYGITFSGTLTGTNVAKISIRPSSLVGPPVAVSQTLNDLDPNADYRFRVVTNKGSTPATEVTSYSLAFKTAAPPPVIGDVGAIQVADTSARLVATIDPRNTETGYSFQYGTTPGLGSSTAPLNIGSGTAPITVSQVVGGLSKDTAYYFRVVATNLSGTTTSASHTFHTRAIPFPPIDPGNCPNTGIRQQQTSTYLPDCRAYEMVSPTDKNQGKIEELVTGFSRDGTGAAFCTTSLFGDPPGQMSGVCTPYVSHRGATSWSTEAAGPRYCNLDGNVGPNVLITHPLRAYLSPESFDRVALHVPELASCPIPPLDASAPVPAWNLYRQDTTTSPFSYQLLAPNGAIEFVDGRPSFGIGNSDFSHIVYMSYVQQSPEPAPGPAAKLYDWVEAGQGGCANPGGCPRLLSVKPSGEPFETESKLPHDALTGPGVADTITSAISADGERIYFQNRINPLQNMGLSTGGCNIPACDLYLRENGASTLEVSASECTSACGIDSSPDAFLWASPSGEKALFASCTKLTDASSDSTECNDSIQFERGERKLYRWDRNGPVGHRLLDLSVDHEPADGSEPRVPDIIGASDDGDTVFFVGAGQLVAGAPTGNAEGEISGTKLKLYRWRFDGGSPRLDYLGPYLSAWPFATVNKEAVEGDPNINRRHARVTPDGKYLVIQTKLALDPAADRDSDADLYRWDEAGGWLCVSCQLPGVPSAGYVDTSQPGLRLMGGSLEIAAPQIASHVPESTISDDGQHIFFETPDALVPQDVNGEVGCPVSQIGLGSEVVYSCEDVYEWDDGTLRLISTGTADGPATLLGATHTGEDVFFVTSQRLVGWDADNSTDIYTAHLGGGYPEPPAQPAICEGEACRGGGTSAPNPIGAGTAAFEGPGNPTPKHHTSRKKHKKRHHKHQRANRNRRVGR